MLSRFPSSAPDWMRWSISWDRLAVLFKPCSRPSSNCSAGLPNSFPCSPAHTPSDDTKKRIKLTSIMVNQQMTAPTTTTTLVFVTRTHEFGGTSTAPFWGRRRFARLRTPTSPFARKNSSATCGVGRTLRSNVVLPGHQLGKSSVLIIYTKTNIGTPVSSP